MEYKTDFKAKPLDCVRGELYLNISEINKS